MASTRLLTEGNGETGEQGTVINTWGDNDVISSFLSMPAVLAAMMYGKEM